MKKMFIFLALVLLAPSIRAADPALAALPGMNAEAADNVQLQRPDAVRILSDLSSELRLSSRQEERITDAVDKKGKEFDKLLKEYDKASAEEKKWRYKVNELKYGMNTITKSVPDAIREFLDDDQRQNFDAMLENLRKGRAAAVAQEAAPAGSAVDAPKPPAKKRKLIKKRRPRAGTESAGEPPAAAADVAPEDEPGLTMVDKDTSSNAPAPKKRRVLKKKAAAPSAETGSGRPAGAQPTGKEAPIEEDAGSYP